MSSPSSSSASPPAFTAPYKTTLTFFLNGSKVVEPSVEPSTTLLSYLRSPRIGLTGAKLGCGEGGCGACTVMVSHWDAHKQCVVNRSINACLAPLASVEGMHVITTEGIGSVDGGLHPVQERIAKFHGSQCGFCTPGIVMALYAFLRNNPEPTMEQLEEAMDGNLCRCTGYRPILSAAKTFASDMGCPRGADCCQNRESAADAPTTVTTVAPHEIPASAYAPYSPSSSESTSLIFPPELANYDHQPLKFHGRLCEWYRPTTLSDLLLLKHTFPHAKIIVGNTEVGIEMTLGKRNYPTLIGATHVPELNAFEHDETSFRFGSSITLTELLGKLDELQRTLPAHQGEPCRAIMSQLRWFSSTQIRNACSPGGNICTASPISDLNPLLQAFGATLHFERYGGEPRDVPVDDSFFVGYRKTTRLDDEVLVYVSVPFGKPNEYFRAYKQARRREDDISIVTSGMRVLLEPASNDEPPVVRECALSFGGMAATTVLAPKTAAFLVGKPWDESVIEQAYAVFTEDFLLPPNVPGGQAEYRNSLAASFLFKFFVSTRLELGPALPDTYKSAVTQFHRGVSSATQEYQLPPNAQPVGQARPHLTASEQVSGEALYVDDIPPAHREAYSALVVSSKPFARIVSINRHAADELDGFIAYIGAEDVPGDNHVGDIVHDEELFATERVTCVGQIIGLAVAETDVQAQRAADLIAASIEYAEIEDEPTVLSIDDAIKHDSFQGATHEIHSGKDIDQALDEADHVVEGEVRVGGQEHFYLETHAAIATPLEGGELLIEASTQNPHKTQAWAAQVLAVHHSRVTCRVKRMGGGFGGKESRSLPISSAVAVAAFRLKRPVRISVKRDVDISVTGQRHPFLGQYRVGFNNDGKLVALDIKLFNNGGNSMDLSLPVLDRALFHADNAYHFPNVRAVGRVCKTHLPSNTAFRGFGGPQSMLIAEEIIDHVARSLGKPVDDVRELNLYHQGDRTHFGQELEYCTLRRIWGELKERSELEARREAVCEFNAANRFRKRGLAMLPTKFGCSFTAKFMNQGGALVHVYTDGSVMLTHGGTEMGQGLHTKMAQICAQAFGVSVDKITVASTATDKVPNTSPTAASMSSDINGMAVLDACNRINERLAPLRAEHPDKSFEEIANMAYFQRISLSANGFWRVPNVGYEFDGSGGTPFAYFSYGASCSEVEVDVLTGDFQIIRSDMVMDVGQSLNPALDIGQIEGAFIQGMGWCTMEELIRGDSDHTWVRPGQMFSRGPGAYKIPSFNDVPIDFRVYLLKDAHNPRAVHSSKAVGEPPFFLSASVFLAIKAAIYAAREERGVDGYFLLNAPASCERIRMANDDTVVKLYTKDRRDENGEFQPKGSW